MPFFASGIRLILMFCHFFSYFNLLLLSHFKIEILLTIATMATIVAITIVIVSITNLLTFC